MTITSCSLPVLPRLRRSHRLHAIAAGAEPEFTAWRDEDVLVQISRHWDRDNPGRALVIPLAHFKNIYTLPDDLAGRIAGIARRVAIAMRRGHPCDGVTVRQNNEPAGGQDVWHLHTHVVPCHTLRSLGRQMARLTSPAGERCRASTRYAARLRQSLATIDQTLGAL